MLNTKNLKISHKIMTDYIPYNCNKSKAYKIEIDEDNNEKDRDEKDKNEINENKINDNEIDDNEIDENKIKENEPDKNVKIDKKDKKKEIIKKDIIYPIGLRNFLYEKNNDSYFNYNNYEMTTGNICYMNSSIQCLFHLEDFTDNITKSAIYKKGDLVRATSSLIEEMKSSKNKNSDLLSVKNIKKAMGKIDERYNDNNEEDANEFISNFLDGLLDEIGNKNNLPEKLNIENESDRDAYNKFYKRFYNAKGNSFLLELFYSILKTQKVCQRCGKVNSIKFNTNNIIELPIYGLAKKGNDIYLNEIIENYLKKNKNISGECKFCSGKIYEKINIYSLPKYLILYFGRTIGNKYINNQIIFPDEYYFNGNTLYQITSVIYHSQLGKKSGHYTASCRCDNDWYYFNDSYVAKEKFRNKHLKPIILIYEKNLK